MFNRYKYQPCQCLCHVKSNTCVFYNACKCNCPSDSERVKENKELKRIYGILHDVFEKEVANKNQLIEDIEQLKEERYKLESDAVAYETYIEQLKAENDNLSLLKNQLKSCIETIAFNHNPQKEACKFLKERTEKLEAEIELLKAQLQNRDKASQDEHSKENEVKPPDNRLAEAIKKQINNSNGEDFKVEDNTCKYWLPGWPTGKTGSRPYKCIFCFDGWISHLDSFKCPYKSKCEVCNGTGILWEDNGEHFKVPDNTGEYPGERQGIDKTERKPHTCPVCEGTGKRKIYDTIAGLYVIATPNCDSCKATGILWESK
jgi:prefoldin subunit 5